MYYFNLDNFNKKKDEVVAELNEVDLITATRTPRGIEKYTPTTRELPVGEKPGIETPPKPTPNPFQSVHTLATNYTDTDIVEEVLSTINIIVDEMYMRDPNQIQYVQRMAEIRGMDSQPLLDNGCFFSPDPSYLEGKFADLNLFRKNFHVSTADNTLWKGRFIIPIRDFFGRVYGFVGYDKFSSAKYVEYSSPVYRKSTIKALGLGNLDEILDKGYCIFTEGSFDYFRGRQHGLPIIANLGIKFNTLLKPLIDRLDFVFTAYDNDDTGKKNQDTIDSLHKSVYHLQFMPIPNGEDFIKGDLDEALKDLDKVKRLKGEIDKRLRFKSVKMNHIKI